MSQFYCIIKHLVQITNLIVMKAYRETHYQIKIGCAAEESPTSTRIAEST